MKDLEKFKQDWIAHKRAKRGTKTDTFLQLLRDWGFSPVCSGPSTGLAQWTLENYTMTPSNGSWFNKLASRKGKGIYRLLGELLGVEDPTESSAERLPQTPPAHDGRSTEQPLSQSGSIQSLQISGFAIDEADEIEKETYDTLKSRVRRLICFPLTFT